MTTRPYADCLADTLALCGVPDSNAEETARVKRFLNMACRRAYSESDYWPRWLRTEERIVSEAGLLPYSEDGKEDIALVRRIFVTEPFAECGAAEYPNFYGKGDGVQIAGYEAREMEGNFDMIITGTLNPDAAGTLPYGGDLPFGAPDGTLRPFYSTNGEYNAPAVGTWVFIYYDGTNGYWEIAYWSSGVTTGIWRSNPTDAMTPDEATGWAPYLVGSGTPIVTADTKYSAWINYKAAFDVTYGDADGDESEVPEEWADFAIYDAYARFLSQDGNKEAGIMESASAYNTYLVPQLERLDRQSGGHVYTRNINHGNTQLR